MAATTEAKPKDINEIPYDAPLSITEPSSSWVRTQTRKGEDSTVITSSLVPDVDISGKWVIITGGNNGIGREAALQMASWGANLVLACRNPPPHEVHPDTVVEECKTAAKEAGYEKATAEWWEIDMADLATVEKFAERWLATGRPIDILCNNAGVGSSPGGGAVFKTKDGFEFIHQINFLSHVLLTLRLLPSIAAAKEPRIVCTTSCFHYPGKFNLANFNGEQGASGLDGVQFYMNNKLFYQVWLTEAQRRFLQHDEYRHITINGVHPGYVNSGIWTLNRPSWWKIPLLKALAWVRGITPQQGSYAITNAATALECGPDPAVQGVGKEGGKGGGR